MNIKFNKRKILLVTVVLSLTGLLIAQVPVYNQKTVYQHVVSALSDNKDEQAPSGSAGHKEAIPEKVWEEIEKLSAMNSYDTMTVSGKLRLYDNLDEDGIKETQQFTLEQSGSEQRLHMGNIDKIEVSGATILIDHAGKEIMVQENLQADSLLQSFRMMSFKQLKKTLVTDGTSAEIVRDKGLNHLVIRPGSMDIVNEYHIYYEPASYRIQKIRMLYTGVPYQNYIETEEKKVSAAAGIGQEVQPDVTNDKSVKEKDEEEDIQIEMDITEYALEFEFEKIERQTSFNFTSNDLFKIVAGEILFSNKLTGYTVLNQ